MAAFASGRRTPAVRVLVLFVAVCLAFCWCFAPHAYAVAETVAVFGLAAVLSAATAALGYKLSNSSQGKATLSQMCSSFAQDTVMGAKVLVGMKIYGLQEGMKYIKMQVKNGKTYLDSKVVAWCQQYLSKQGVYNESSIKSNVSKGSVSLTDASFSSFSVALDSMRGLSFKDGASLPFDSSVFLRLYNEHSSELSHDVSYYNFISFNAISNSSQSFYVINFRHIPLPCTAKVVVDTFQSSNYSSTSGGDALSFTGLPSGTEYAALRCIWDGSEIKPFSSSYVGSVNTSGSWNYILNPFSYAGSNYYSRNTSGVCGSNYGLVGVSGNMTGLSGTDTLGKDYVNLTLDQILAGLKDWAKDWYDAGVESVLDGAVEGDIDLPLTVGAGAATLNPDVAADEDLVYTPSFDLPLEDVRSGSTAATDVTAGLDNAANQTASADIAENQSVVDSLVSWLKDYFSVDKGMFSRFPLCVPYDAYLLVTSALGYDPPHSASDIFNNNPDTASHSLMAAQASSDWEPVIDLSSDMQVNGQTVPLDLKLDLTMLDDIMRSTVRPMVTIYLLGCLIGAELWRLNHDGK